MTAPQSHVVLVAVATIALVSFAPTVHAAPLEALPVTVMDTKEPLTHFHPAFGAQVPDAVVEYRIAREDLLVNTSASASLPDEPAATVAASALDLRRLEETNEDIKRLEDYFKSTMERNLETLKKYDTASFSPAPWPSSYWPIYADGINHRWAGADVPSPSEKYATVFGLNVKQFTDAVSQSNGILSMASRRACTKSEDCASLKDGSTCGMRRGQTKGYCIPGWFGICHAWAPAAILEPEPKCAVKKGSTTFQPFDIKALLTQVYDGARVPTVFTGARFNGPDSPENKDKYGRYNDAARRDLGPGFFHIAIHNIMGRFNKSFVVDVTAGAEVWNQPVRSYQVLELKDVALDKAVKQYFGVNDNKWAFNTAAKKLKYVKTKFSWIVESVEDGELVSNGRVNSYTQSTNYEYILELDSSNSILGGEWVGDSRTNHPDFLWFPDAAPSSSTVTKIGLSYNDVKQLLDASLKCVDLDPEPTPTPTPTPTTPAPKPTSATAAPTPTPALSTATPVPTTVAPTPEPISAAPTPEPSTVSPSPEPSTVVPTPEPSTVSPSPEPSTVSPTPDPSIVAPTPEPDTIAPTPEPNTVVPAPQQTPQATTLAPTREPTPVPSSVPPTPEPSSATSAPEPASATPTPEPSSIVPTPTPSLAVPTPAPSSVIPISTVAPSPTPSSPSPVPMSTTPIPQSTTRAPTKPVPAPSPTKLCATPRFGYCGRQGVASLCCPAGYECQSLNRWFSQCMPVTAKCATQQFDVSFRGVSIAQVYNIGAPECCERCSKTPGCKGYTLVGARGKSAAVCHLKASVSRSKHKSGAVSAVLQSPTSSQDQQHQQNQMQSYKQSYRY